LWLVVVVAAEIDVTGAFLQYGAIGAVALVCLTTILLDRRTDRTDRTEERKSYQRAMTRIAVTQVTFQQMLLAMRLEPKANSEDEDCKQLKPLIEELMRSVETQRNELERLVGEK